MSESRLETYSVAAVVAIVDPTCGGTDPGGGTVTDAHDGESGSPTPAEAQFPYIAVHGIQASAPPPASFADRPPRPHGRPRWLPGLAVGIGLVALTMVAALLTWNFSHPLDSPRSGAAAVQAVRGYLEALAEGDAAVALGYAAHPPPDASLLTDQVLAEQRALAPISGIEVQLPTETGQVPASYLLGGQPVAAVFGLSWQGDQWRLDEVAAQIDLTDLSSVPIAINGVRPASLTPSLFPGQYRVTSAAPRYRVTDDEFDVLRPYDRPGVPRTFELSAAGRAEVIAAAEATLEDCLRQHRFAPRDCGFAITHPQQTTLDESSVRWSSSGAPDFHDIAIALDHPGSASAVLDVAIRGEAHGLDGSQWKADLRLTRMRADLTGPVVRIQFS